jgi:hypothetical protein
VRPVGEFDAAISLDVQPCIGLYSEAQVICSGVIRARMAVLGPTL